MIVVDIADEMTPFVQELVKSKSRIVGRAFKSLGWFFRKKTQEGIKSGSPGGETFADRTPLYFRRAFDNKAPKVWYGKLRSAIAYTYKNETGELHIGWRTSTAANVGSRQEYGFSRVVTNKVRAKYASLGFRISKNVIDVPERPFFLPMAKDMADKIAPYITQKVEESLEMALTHAKSRRVYKQYGG